MGDKENEMEIRKLLAVLCLSIFLVYAQDITNKLGGNTASETYDITDSDDDLLLRVQGDNGLLVNGTFGTGTIPTTGAGTRLMWYPAKAAFRVGYVDDTQWDADSIGEYSVALGYQTKALGNRSFAVGDKCQALGNKSVAMGESTIASGLNSFAAGEGSTAQGNYSVAFGNSTASGYSSKAFGSYTTASGIRSTTFGLSTTASGENSTAMGQSTIASGLRSLAIGRGIEVSGTTSVGIALDNQTGTNVSQNNTMAIMGGKVGIGTTTPDATLEITGTVKMFGDWSIDTYYFETEYQAPSDGFVIAQMQNSSSSNVAKIKGYTDSTSPVSTQVAYTLSNTTLGVQDIVQIVMPVKKGDYWKVTDGDNGSITAWSAINWIPLGQ